MDTFFIIGCFLLLISAILFLRNKFQSLEVKGTDILLALTPVLLFLILTGRLSKLQISENGLDIESVLTHAAQTHIKGLEMALDVQQIPTQLFNTSNHKPDLTKTINNNTEALSFVLNFAHYDAAIIMDYIQKLSEKPFLKYLVFLDADNKLVGMCQIQSFIIGMNKDEQTIKNYHLFTQWLKKGEENKLANLIPGYLSANEALSLSSTRHDALKKMQIFKTSVLPVINKKGRFIGLVDKATLSSSLLLEIYSQLDLKH